MGEAWGDRIMPISLGAVITEGPTNAKVSETIRVKSAHTVRITNNSGATVQCEVTYRLSHDRPGSHKMEETYPHTITNNGRLELDADKFLDFAPEVTGPHRMKAETIVTAGALGDSSAESTNWTIQVSEN